VCVRASRKVLKKRRHEYAGICRHNEWVASVDRFDWRPMARCCAKCPYVRSPSNLSTSLISCNLWGILPIAVGSKPSHDLKSCLDDEAANWLSRRGKRLFTCVRGSTMTFLETGRRP